MLLKRPRRIQLEPSGPKSVDEQIQDLFEEILQHIEEIEDKQLRDQWIDGLSAFTQQGDVDALSSLTMWRRPVVPLDEFLFGAGYLNQRDEDIYPGVLKALWDLEDDAFDEVIELGAIGIGKTTLANLKMGRSLYKISCMRNPHRVYGIGTGTPIVFTIQSVRLATAKKVVFGEFGRYIRESPYFKTRFMYDKMITSEMVFHEQNISILPVSSSGSAAISMNVIGGQLDEVNFMQKTIKSKSSQADEKGEYDQAKALYNTLASRRKSRFLNRGDLPGELFLISSSRFPDDFTEIKAAESSMRGGSDEQMYVFGGSQWDIKGRDNRSFFTAEDFTVQIGNESYPSRVLKRDPDTGEDLELPAPGTETIRIPMTFYKDFQRDVDNELRNIAGRTTLSTSPFFTQKEKIKEAFDLGEANGYRSPLLKQEFDLSAGLPALDRRYTRTDVEAPRHCHIDLGITRDACGFAIGHVAGYKVDKSIDEDGKERLEVLPVLAYDVIARIVPPMGGEIELEQVRQLLRKIKARYHIPVESVSFDGFQSVDSRQLLHRAGFKTSKVSVEGVEPWRAFRDAVYDGRVLLPQHDFLRKELADVERKVTNNKEKVDHRPNGTKDVADAVVGVAAFLLRRRSTWSQMAVTGGRTGLFLLGDPKRSKTPDNVIIGDQSVVAGGRAGSNRRRVLRRKTARK